jgi:hypothetical protein
LFTVAVICRTLFRVSKYLVSLRHLLEALFGVGRALIPVRVVFEGKLSISLLDLLGACLLRHSEQLIVVRHLFPGERQK